MNTPNIADTLGVFNPIFQSGPPVNPTWNHTYGGPEQDRISDMIECSNGDYALVGTTFSYGVSYSAVWLVRTDAEGTFLWNRTFDAPYFDMGTTIVECASSGFAILGTIGWPFVNPAIWLIRTDDNGNHLWNRTLGFYTPSQRYNFGSALVECAGGGFAIAGHTNVHHTGYDNDIWVITTNPLGQHIWNKTYGTSYAEFCNDMVKYSEGGYILTGYAFDSSTSNYNGWLMRIDISGNKFWNRTYDNSLRDYCYGVVECSDRGLAITGSTNSTTDGNDNVWLIRTNPTGVERWNRTYGGTNPDNGLALVECSTGGFALVGTTRSYGAGSADAWLVRTDANGLFLWDFTFGYSTNEFGTSVVECASGGFVFAGETNGTLLTDWDGFLVRVADYIPPTTIGFFDPLLLLLIGGGLVALLVCLLLVFQWRRRKSVKDEE